MTDIIILYSISDLTIEIYQTITISRSSSKEIVVVIVCYCALTSQYVSSINQHACRISIIGQGIFRSCRIFDNSRRYYQWCRILHRRIDSSIELKSTLCTTRYTDTCSTISCSQSYPNYSRSQICHHKWYGSQDRDIIGIYRIYHTSLSISQFQ